MSSYRFFLGSPCGAGAGNCWPLPDAPHPLCTHPSVQLADRSSQSSLTWTVWMERRRQLCYWFCLSFSRSAVKEGHTGFMKNPTLLGARHTTHTLFTVFEVIWMDAVRTCISVIECDFLTLLRVDATRTLPPSCFLEIPVRGGRLFAGTKPTSSKVVWAVNLNQLWRLWENCKLYIQLSLARLRALTNRADLRHFIDIYIKKNMLN